MLDESDLALVSPVAGEGKGGRSRSYQSDEIMITHEVRMESYERDDVGHSETESEWGLVPGEYAAGGPRRLRGLRN